MRRMLRRVKRGVNGLLVRVIGYRIVKATPTDGRVLGLVEEVTKKAISGWVAAPAGSGPVRVILAVNGHEILSTWATERISRNVRGDALVFSFAVSDLWTYCKARYRVTVRAHGTPLPIVGQGMHLTPEADGRSSLSALQRQLAAGHVFGPTGRLKLSKRLDTDWQRKVFSLHDRVSAILRDTYDYEVMLVYGTLLGAIRDGDFIGHDLDFDTGYVSRARTGAEAVAEFRDIALLLVERGFDVDAHRTALHIYDPGDRSAKIDLMHLYFGASGTLQFPFGVAGTTEIPEGDWKGTRPIELAGATVRVPVNAEQVVEHIYGAGWRSPKPGFDWARERTKRDTTGIMPIPLVESVRWENFYTRTEYEHPSSFFAAVDRRADMPDTVIDVGSGEGRDALAFGRSGRTVLGLDRSRVGVERATRRATEEGLDARVRFVICDVTEPGAFGTQVAPTIEAAAGPVLFYLRFLLHGLSEPEQDAVLDAIDDCARAGDLIAVELRVSQDQRLPKAHTGRFRRFQPALQVAAALRDRRGWILLSEEEGTGLSPYRNEDPYLYRIVARRA